MATSVAVGEASGRRVEEQAGRRLGDSAVVTKASEEGEVEESGRDNRFHGTVSNALTRPSRLRS
jgi:hypothetical protein